MTDTQNPNRTVSSLRPFVLLGGALLLAGCTGDEITRTFGLTRDAPDEFQVTTRAPLSMPPDFSLRPPRPGATRPQEQSSRTAAEATLAPATELQAEASSSPGQAALVGQAGPAAPADIRRRIDAEAAADKSDRSLTDRLMFWRSASNNSGTVVDPTRESQRLRENAALGQNVEVGDTPIIQRKKTGAESLLDRIF